MTALLLAFLSSAMPIPSGEFKIQHEPIGCVLAGRYPLIEATVALPGEAVLRARVYFKSDLAPYYWFVPMTRRGQSFSGRLPKPKSEAERVSYYIFMSSSAAEDQTNEIETRVLDEASECPEGARVAATGRGKRVCAYAAGRLDVLEPEPHDERCRQEYERMKLQPPPSGRLEDLERLEIVPLDAALDHVQGIDVEGDSLWVSSVERQSKRGLLHLFDRRTGRLRAQVSLERGARYHPGGIARDGDSIWVPLAEYARASSALVQRRDKKTLALVSEFEVADHVGCLAAGDTLIGGNWDSRIFYEWTRDGRLLRQRQNPRPNAYQDLKRVGKQLVGAGKLSAEEGAIDWLDPETLELQLRVLTGKTDRSVLFTNEGMAIRDGKLYLLPEDGPSRLFVFRLR